MKPQLLYLTEWAAVCVLSFPHAGRGQIIASSAANKLILTSDTIDYTMLATSTITRNASEDALKLNDKAPAFSVYPNPAKSNLTLEYYSEKREDIKAQIIDSKGAVVRQWQLNMEPGRNVKNMNLVGLAKGIYALQTIGINGTMVSRFVKE